MDNLDRLKIAYKKLKATVFFDKTQLPLRDQLVQKETEIEKQLPQLETALFDNAEWEDMEKEILNSVGILLYPKSLIPVDDKTAIFNSDSIDIEMEKPQYFIGLSPVGHILGTLWVLEIGRKLDQNAGENGQSDGMYPHSYGNRLKKNLISQKTDDYTYAPGLFEPYFSQYESWRDRALEQAKKRLEDKQDALILTLDFKSFFYSVDIQREWFENCLSCFGEKEDWRWRLHRFVYKVIQRYSEKLREIHTDNDMLSIGKRNVLPIGFLPSNILSNVMLTPFDNAVIKELNPVYYGRYVDDIMIVDKVEANSDIYKLAREKDKEKRLNADKIMELFFCDTCILKTDDNEEYSYCVAEEVLPCGKSHVTVQNTKVKLFYFQSGATKALLDCFRSKIQNNISEFRYLPELDSVMKYHDYSELFQLKNKDSINKLRSVTGIELDKFSLAKFLGKYRKVGGLIQSKEENAFAEDALVIFDERVLIENYLTWERLFEIFVVNQRLDIVEKLAIRIISAICRCKASAGCIITKANCQGKPETVSFDDSFPTHDALLRFLRAALGRTLALVWGKKCEEVLNNLNDEIDRIKKSGPQAAGRFKKNTLASFSPKHMNALRRAYCKTRMVNKYILPLPIDSIISQMQFTDQQEINLCAFADCSSLVDGSWHEQDVFYHYYPYVFLPQDIMFSLTYDEIASGRPLPPPGKLLARVRNMFLSINYPNCGEDRSVYDLDNIKSGSIERLLSFETEDRKYYGTVIDCDSKDVLQKLRIAVGNVELSESDLRRALDRRPVRSYERYAELRKVMNEAIENDVHMLVLPELYVPIEWIPMLSRACANNQLALITGVEYILSRSSDDIREPSTVYNLTAVILPYIKGEHKFSHVLFHNKVNYSPAEKSLIPGYHHKMLEGKSYELYCWRGIWFSVYCCYELSSIHDRAVFQSYADLLVAVEWNRDISYFSNIVESLVRDMHCFCVQANSSKYGDIRLMQPTETQVRDSIRTKGGKNACILFDEIDVQALRDFQAKSLELQKKDGPFKQTPPDLDMDILNQKRNGTLKSVIKYEPSNTIGTI